jgi:hypothetical protein
MNSQRICYPGESCLTLGSSHPFTRPRGAGHGDDGRQPPGQAILVRGVETLKVMMPYLPDDERAQRLAGLRQGEIELTDAKKAVLHTAKC